MSDKMNTIEYQNKGVTLLFLSDFSQVILRTISLIINVDCMSDIENGVTFV